MQTLYFLIWYVRNLPLDIYGPKFDGDSKNSNLTLFGKKRLLLWPIFGFFSTWKNFKNPALFFSSWNHTKKRG